MIERLAPHIRQFVQMRRLVAGAETLGASLGELLDNTRVGVIQLDLRGWIVEANERARLLLWKGDGLFDEAGLLHARRGVDDAGLQGLLASALPSFGHPDMDGSMTMRRPAGQARLAVHVNPVDACRVDFGLRRVTALVKGASLTSLHDGWCGTYHPAIRRRCPWSPASFCTKSS